MSASHPVILSFAGAEHHLTFDEAHTLLSRLASAIGLATGGPVRGMSSIEIVCQDRDEWKRRAIAAEARTGELERWVAGECAECRYRREEQV